MPSASHARSFADASPEPARSASSFPTPAASATPAPVSHRAAGSSVTSAAAPYPPAASPNDAPKCSALSGPSHSSAPARGAAQRTTAITTARDICSASRPYAAHRDRAQAGGVGRYTAPGPARSARGTISNAGAIAVA